MSPMEKLILENQVAIMSALKVLMQDNETRMGEHVFGVLQEAIARTYQQQRMHESDIPTVTSMELRHETNSG